MTGIGLNQLHLLIITTCQGQIVDGLLIYKKHRSGGTILGRHIGDGCAITQCQGCGTFAMKLKVGTHHTLLAQEFSQCQHHIRGSDTRL